MNCKDVIALNEMEKLSRSLSGGEKGEALRRLGTTPEGKKLESMIDGAALEKALESRNAAALQKMLGALLSTPEGRRLAADVEKIMGK